MPNSPAVQLSLLDHDPEFTKKMMLAQGHDAAKKSAKDKSHEKAVDTYFDYIQSMPVRGYFHSVLCALSLPLRRPKDEYAPIHKQQGKLTLVIAPSSGYINGEGDLEKVGVPFGHIPRLILAHITSEAVKNNSKVINIGRTKNEFMRRLGYKSFGGGKRGTCSLFDEQLKRLLNCEWTIRFNASGANQPDQMVNTRLSAGQTLWRSKGNGEETSQIILSKDFFDHLQDHRIEFDEAALKALKDDPTCLDLYSYLAYRLPRIEEGRSVHISWEQLSTHLGLAVGNSESAMRKFRFTIKQKLPRVLAVYTGADVSISAKSFKMNHSPIPYCENRSRGYTYSEIADNILKIA